jgi:hypothetical protein
VRNRRPLRAGIAVERRQNVGVDKTREGAMPRWMVIVIACLLAGGIGLKWSHGRGAVVDASAEGPGRHQREAMLKSLSDMNKRMPIQVNPMVRIERMELVNDVALVYVSQTGIFEPSDEDKASFARLLKADYCNGKLKAARDAGVAIEMDLKTPGRTLDEPFGKTWVVSVAPAQCV